MVTLNLRTLFVTRYLPYPPTGGSPLRIWQNMNLLKQYGEVGVFTVFPSQPSVEAFPGIQHWQHYRLSRSRFDAYGKQSWWLALFRNAELERWHEVAAGRKLAELVATFQPELIVLAEIWLYKYLRYLKDYAGWLIFDNHNLEANLIQQQYQSISARRGQLFNLIDVPRIKGIERRLIEYSDQVWMCSQEDTDLLASWYGKTAQSHAKIVVNGIDSEYYAGVRNGNFPLPDGWQPNPHTLIFVGTLNYPPNVEAAEWLIEQIFPQLCQIYPDCRLLLVGKHPPSKLKEMAQAHPAIVVTGRVPDVRPYLAAATAVAIPLCRGSGTRLKIVEAFAAGRPIVSTAKGAEGLAVKDRKHLLIANDTNAIVEAIQQLWSDPALSATLVSNAYHLLQETYSWEAAGRQVEQALLELVSRPR